MGNDNDNNNNNKKRYDDIMKSFKSYITEADTSSATNEEMAIVYVYNKHQGLSHEEATSQGLITEKDFAKLTPDMLKIAEDIYLKNLSKGSRGNVMKMAGEKSGPNYYEGASDTTSKADFYGNKKNRISLKESGGAQLISSKSAEAAGTVNAAILHYQKAEGTAKIKKNALYKKAIDTLENKMLESARNDAVVYVKSGKRSIKDWYINDSGRVEALLKNKLLKKTYTGKKGMNKILKHVQFELQALNAYTRSSGYEKHELPEVPKAKGNGASGTWKTDMFQPNIKTMKEKIFPAFVRSGTDMEFKSNETKYIPSKWSNKQIRKHITELISVSIDTVEWKNDLTSFFTENEELKKWVIYEAASGLYKFTKQISDGKDYTGDNWRVANKMLVFTGGKGGGFNKEYVSIFKWSQNHANLIEQMDISYKGQGTNRYIKFGIPTKLSESIDECVDSEMNILNEELECLEEQYYLHEGIFDIGGIIIDKAKGIAKTAATYAKKIKDAVARFYERVVKKFMLKIRELAESSISEFLDMIGLKLEAKLKIGTIT